MNVVVFTLLIFIMLFLSWILYTILSHTVLRETKLDKQIKKQKKLEKKNLKAEPQVDPNKPKAIPLGPPNKRRLWGALIGSVQGFLLLFLILMPVTSLTSSFGEVMSGPTVNSENSLVVFAEENELLSEYSSDIIKNTLGENIVSYFETFNNAIPTKILTVGGLNNSIFDSLSSVKVNGERVAIRRDAIIATKIYDNYMLVVEQIGYNEKFSELDVEVVRDAVDLLFETGLFRAFAEEALPYVLDLILNSEMIPNTGYSVEFEEALLLLIDSYKEDSSGFIKSFKKDMSALIDVAESALKCGLVDEAIIDIKDYDSLIRTVKKDNYKFLYDFTNNGYNSYIFRILTSKGLNIGLNIFSEKLSTETTHINLGTTNYEQIIWTSVKTPVFNFFKNTLDLYDIIKLYGIEDILANPKDFIADLGVEDINSLMTLLGKELDLVKNSPLFVGQTNNPVKGLITWLGSQNSLNELIDSSAMLAIPSWEVELNNFSSSLVGLKESESLDIILGENVDDNLDALMDNLLQPVSESPSADTYLKQILNPLLSSLITKKVVVYGLNFVNSSISGITLNSFTVQQLTPDQNADIIVVAEHIARCFSIFNGEPIDLETLDTTKIAGLLTALQSNAFRKGTVAELNSNSVNLAQKTVTGGGIFANYYIALVTYIVGDSASINYKTINWLNFFESAQNLSGNISDITEGSLEEFLNLGNEGAQEHLENLLESLGLDNSIVSDLSDLQGAIDSLNNGDLTEEEEEEAYESINSALESILNSTDEEGTPTIDAIVNIIQTFTEEDLSDQISSAIIASEQTVSNRLLFMTKTYSPINPLDYADSTLDTIHTDMSVLDATIADLTCGATYVLNQAVNSGTKIFVTNIDPLELNAKINNATTNEEIRTLVMSLFVIV
jgi:hypothetical protein